MKRIPYTLLLGLGILLFNTTHLYARSSDESVSDEMKHEFKIQIQDGLPISLGMGIADAIGNIFSVYSRESDGGFSMPFVSLGYRYHISKHVSVGVNASYMKSLSRYKLTHNNTGEKRRGETKHEYFSITPTLEVFYLNSPIVQLYGNLSTGILFAKTDKTIIGERHYSSSVPVLDFQINPIGIRVGKQVAGYVEVGFGMKGFATLGLSVDI